MGVVSKIPEKIPWDQAAPLFCAGATVYGALLAVDPKPGQWCAQIGIGGLGHLGVQYAKAMGMKVIASPEAEQQVAEELMGSFYDTNPGVDRIVINAEAPHLIKFSQKFLRKGGQL